MKKIYKKYRIAFYNNDNQLKRVFIDADNTKQAIDKIINQFNIFNKRIVSVSLFSTTKL